MKRLILFLFIICSSLNLSAQSLSVFSIDDSSFPVMKAKIFALDETGNIISGLNKDDIIINEDGIQREVLSLQCPELTPPDAISSVLTIDVSGSMSGANILKAQAAARAWVNALALGKSESALTTFDSENYLNCDFTTNKNTLLEAIAGLKAQGGTDFNAALIKQLNGSLLVAEAAKHKKVIVMLTDGYSNGDENAIVQKALSINAVIHFVILGNPAPEILKNIAKRTGGQYFDNIETEQQAEDAYRIILQSAQGGEPCEISYLSGGCPNNRTLKLDIPNYSLFTENYYTVDFSRLPVLAVLPSISYKFGEVAPGNFASKKVKIAAGNMDVLIQGIEADNSKFKFKNFPTEEFILKAGEFIEFSLEYHSLDSTYQFSRITIKTDACTGTYFYASAGFTNSSVKPNTLYVIHPNGGEIFPQASDTVITWGGASPIDTMKIELSTDGGINWEMLTNKADNNSYTVTLPDIESDKCLIRIKQIEGSGSKVSQINGHTFYVKDIDIFPPNKLLASSGNDRVLKVRNYETGETVFQTTSVYIFQKVCFNLSGTMLAAAMSDNSVHIYSTQDWAEIKVVPDTKGWVSAMSFAQGDSILCIVNGNNTLKYYNFNSNETVDFSVNQSNIVEVLPIMSSGSSCFYSFSGDGNIKEVSINKEVTRTINVSGGITSAVISPDNYKFGIISSNGRNISFYDIASGTLIDDIKTSETLTKLSWSKDGITLAAGDNKGNVYFYDAETKELINQNKLHYNSVTDLVWDSSDILISCGNDNYIFAVFFDLSIQEAVSENYWSIAPLKLDASDIVFTDTKIGFSNNQIINSFIKNNSKFDIKIDSVRITNDNYSEFQIISGYGEKLLSSNTARNIEVSFSPKFSGSRYANISIYTGGKILNYNISGTGINSEITELTRYVNFGLISTEERKDTVIKIFANISDIDLTVSDIKMIGPDTVQFTYSNDYKNNISKGDTFELELSFAPIKKGKSSSAVIVYFGNNNEYKLQVNMLGDAYSNCGESSFSYNIFDEISNFNTAGIAALSSQEHLVNLTSASPQNTGALWTKELIPLDSGFTVEFVFSMTEPYQGSETENSEPGADGLAFVIQNQSNKAIGMSGGGIAYEGIKNAIAIEYDLYANDKNQINDKYDPNGNHIALMVQTDTAISATHYENNTLAMNKDILIMKSNGTKYYSKIVYNPFEKTLLVYLDTAAIYNIPVISVNNFELKNYIDLAYNSGAYIGFTSSSGSAFQRHRINSWRLCNSLSAQPIISSVDEIYLSNYTVFPNPASDYIEIRQPSEGFEPSECSNIKIYNAFGESLISTPSLLRNATPQEGNLRVDISNLPVGVYYIRIGEYIDKFIVIR